MGEAVKQTKKKNQTVVPYTGPREPLGHEFEQDVGKGRTREPGMLQFMGSQRVRHELVTEEQQGNTSPTLSLGCSKQDLAG